MKTLFASIITFICITASAYIPNLEMITDRMVSNHGYGMFVIDQEVTIHADPKPYIVHEQWLIENESLSRLRVRGLKDLEGKLDMTYVYNYNRRYTINEDGRKVASPLSNYFLEPFFHFRKANYFKNKLALIGAAPRSVINNLSKGSTNISSNSHMRLARQGGVANYFVGKPSSAGGEKYAGAWVEQDQFVLRKLRFSDNTEITAKDYGRNSRGLMFPKERTVRWGEHTADIYTKKVSTASSASSHRIRHAKLDPKKEEHLVRKMPDIAIIKEFYGRFR